MFKVTVCDRVLGKGGIGSSFSPVVSESFKDSIDADEQILLLARNIQFIDGAGTFFVTQLSEDEKRSNITIRSGVITASVGVSGRTYSINDHKVLSDFESII